MRAARYLMIAFMALVLVMLYYSATMPGEPGTVSGPASAPAGAPAGAPAATPADAPPDRPARTP